MNRIPNSGRTPQIDFTCGTYRDGVFTPYGSKEKTKASLDKESDSEAKHMAVEGFVLHGSFKEGNFRPAEISDRQGYVHSITLHGASYSFKYTGEIMDPYSGEVVAHIDKEGSVRRGKNVRLNDLLGFIGIAGFVGGVLILRSSVTGYVIMDLASGTTSIVGAGLLVIGLVAGVFWLKRYKSYGAYSFH